MRRRGKRNSVLAWLCIAVGIMVILGMILPVSFWWFMLGVSLIALGLGLKRSCC